MEPCAFVHFAADNIKGKKLEEVLKNPFFRAYREHRPFSENLLRPCPLIDQPENMRAMVQEAGVSPTHIGADSILHGSHARQIDRIAAAWETAADRLRVELQNESAGTELEKV